MNAYKLINLGFKVISSTDEHIFFVKKYKNNKVFSVRCDLITTAILKVTEI